MANTIITKNSSTASAVPAAGSLTQGELAVNVTDKKLYTKNSGGSVVEITPSVALYANSAGNGGVTSVNGQTGAVTISAGSATPEAGSVVQVVYASSKGTASGYGWVPGVVSATITPKYANSKIVGFVQANLLWDSELQAYARLKVNGTDIYPATNGGTWQGTTQFIMITGYDSYNSRNGTFSGEYSSGSTAPQTWTYEILSSGEWLWVQLNYGGSYHTITLMEIKV